MKKHTILYLFFLFYFNTIVNAQIGRQQSDSMLNNYIIENNIEKKWIYFCDTIQPTDKIAILYGDTIIAPDEESFVYFVDERPLQGWSHPCRFVFIDKSTGQIRDSIAKFPPKGLSEWDLLLEENEKLIYQKQIEQRLPSFNKNIKRSNLETDHCYAVIISGGGSKDANWMRYWNDCAAIYSALINTYGYKDENIYVIMSDGTSPYEDRRIGPASYDSSPLDLDGDGDDDITNAATITDISNVFNNLSTTIAEDDFLFIYTIDHGNVENGISTLCLWNDEELNANDFARIVNRVKAKTMCITMGQCYSGGFLPYLSKKGRIIATACNHNEMSLAQDIYTYDEFVYHWTSAVNKCTPDGNPVNADYNLDGYVSIKEAFDYANLMDTKPETPQYLSNKEHYGEFVTLYGNNLCSKKTIANYIYIGDCTEYGCELTVSGVQVRNNSTLTLESMGDIIITDNFYIELGSSLEVK